MRPLNAESILSLDSPGEGRPNAIEAEEINSLVRQLFCYAANLAQSVGEASPSQTDPDVLLDVTVEDIRCVVTRLNRQDQQPKCILSAREIEIARMVAKGHPNKMIAAVLDISIWTVNTHIRRVFAKLGVGSRAAMVAYLLQYGLMGEHRQVKTASR